VLAAGKDGTGEAKMTRQDGLITGYHLDGNGGGREIGWEQIDGAPPDGGFQWIHLDYTAPRAQQWVREHGGLDEVIAAALLTEETRPRSLVTKDGLLVALRGVNMNPGADPEDMVAIRIWVGAGRIISTRRRRLLSVDDMRTAIGRGAGPRTPGEFVVDIADRLVARMADVIDDLDEKVDTLEDRVVTAESHQLRPMLAALRREAIALRRYLGPQREAMSRLYTERVPCFDEVDRMRLREVADRTLRYIEDLDAARDRAAVTQEELVSRLSEQMDKRMYVLSMVAAVFLPLGFLTGLLGINVAGIPGADYKPAFIIVCLFLIVLVTIQVWLFRRRRWL